MDGVGAAVLPAPPVAETYHNREVPVAVRVAANVFWQYVTGLMTDGADGKAFTFTVIAAL